MKSNYFNKRRLWLGKQLSSRMARWMLAMKTEYRFAEIYGDFHFGEDYKKLGIGGLPNESGEIRGEIVKMLGEISGSVQSLLLPGESRVVKPIFASLLNLDVENIVTTGLSDDVDWRWDFEEAPPEFGSFQCIISQAMIEHLIDPYKHVRECISHLDSGGYMILHTVLPGFQYHRYPVDCLRFFPDWFEEVAKRLGLEVKDKYISRSHITYQYLKP